MNAFKREDGNWLRYRQLPNLVEVDFHRVGFDLPLSDAPYYERMQQVGSDALDALINAQAAGKDWVLFTHGWSTSRLGATTSRSQVRSLMRSPQATPYIVRAECIQHDSVFVARIRNSKPA